MAGRYINESRPHLKQYYIPPWHTSLVTPPSYTGSNASLPSWGAAEYWSQGSKRVSYANVTLLPSNDAALVAAINASLVQALSVFTAWSTNLTNGTDRFVEDLYAAVSNYAFWAHAYTQANALRNFTALQEARYQVTGAFTTYVTHLSNDLSLKRCCSDNATSSSCYNLVPSAYSSADDWVAALNATAAQAVVDSARQGLACPPEVLTQQQQCPFTFKCFSREAAVGAPRCLREMSQYEGSAAHRAGEAWCVEVLPPVPPPCPPSPPPSSPQHTDICHAKQQQQ
jgi:hypothetical protein